MVKKIKVFVKWLLLEKEEVVRTKTLIEAEVIADYIIKNYSVNEVDVRVEYPSDKNNSIGDGK